jgi:hypothetical protein
VKYSAYGVGSYDSQSHYFPYVDILNLTVEKIPYIIVAAAAEVVGSNPIRSVSFIRGKYGIELGSFLTILCLIHYMHLMREGTICLIYIILAELVIAAPQTIGGLCAFIA